MQGAFFDSNIVLCLTDGRDSRRLVSRDLIKDGGTISTQVLNEITRTLRHKKFGYDWDRVGIFLAGIGAKCDVVPLTVAIHDRALVYAQRYQLGIFDANIVAAAVLADCTTLYSEDMQDGLIIDGLTIRNPFAAD